MKKLINGGTPTAASAGDPIRTYLKQLRIVDYILGPKLPHYPLYILRPEAISMGMFVAELTEAHDPRVWVAGVWGKRRIGRLMNDALRCNIELIAPD
jgi:hypothetical protein